MMSATKLQTPEEVADEAHKLYGILGTDYAEPIRADRRAVTINNLERVNHILGKHLRRRFDEKTGETGWTVDPGELRLEIMAILEEG